MRSTPIHSIRLHPILNSTALHVRSLALALIVGAAIALAGGSLRAQAGGVDLDTIRAGRFDNGKMWTFEYPPSEYFTETYGFNADEAWFERARLSVLRIPGCSASFVSPNGLVATNHHCVRGAVSRISGEGERLLDTGFFAATLEEERRIPGYYADQLLAVVDVSGEVFAAVDRAATDEERESLRAKTLQAVQARLKAEHAAAGDSVWVQIVGLYHGGRYSAYVFRRFTDVRLVGAVELQLGFFGGDPDNFTYPRYALDFAFLRVYAADGNPYRPQHYFSMAGRGVEEGDVVFVIGNPGQTNRLRTVAQLEYQRDVQVPAMQRYLESRHGVLGDFLRDSPAEAEALGIRNRMFGLSNSLKAYTGRLEALNDPVILARRRDSESQLREAIAAVPELRERYAGLFDRMAEIQLEKARYAAAYSALLGQTSRSNASATLRRAFVADAYLEAQAAGMPADTLAMIQEEFERIGDHPEAIERGTAALRAYDEALGRGGRAPEHGPRRRVPAAPPQRQPPGDRRLLAAHDRLCVRRPALVRVGGAGAGVPAHARRPAGPRPDRMGPGAGRDPRHGRHGGRGARAGPARGSRFVASHAARQRPSSSVHGALVVERGDEQADEETGSSRGRIGRTR